MWTAEWQHDDMAFLVSTQRGTIARVCHTLDQAIEATVEVGVMPDDQYDFRVM